MGLHAGPERIVTVRRAIGRSLMSAAIGLAVVGCQAAGELPSSQTTGAEAASAVRSPAPTSRPTATPVPIEELFVRKTRATTSASGTIEGTFTYAFGEREAPVRGTFAFDGRDSAVLIRTGIGAEQIVTEIVALSGERYTRQGDGPWLKDPGGAPPTSDMQLGRLLGDPAKLERSGHVVRDGRRLHRLTITDVAAEELQGFGVPAAARGDTRLEFYAEEDGTPAGLGINASWSQELVTGETEVEMRTEYSFQRIPATQRIERPTEVWVLRPGPENAYSFAVPEDWDVEEYSDGLLLRGPEADTIFIATMPVPADTTLNAWSAQTMATIQRDVDPTVSSSEPISVSGLPGRLLSFPYVDDYGVKAHGMVATFLAPGRGYDIFWFSVAGGESRDLTVFRRFLSVFTAAPAATASPPAPAAPSPSS